MIERIRPIVQKFAQYGLDESKQSIELFHKWLDVWSFGLIGEIGEAYSALKQGDCQEFRMEVADICWYTVALELLLQDNALENIVFEDPMFKPEPNLLLNAIVYGLQYTEKVKKYRRDYPERDISSVEGYQNPLMVLNGSFDFSTVAEDLEQKLSKRYPKGFTPQDSVNRTS